MKISEIVESVRFSLQSLRANKTRSSLTSLGVVIGIGFVVLMGWSLNGLEQAWEKTISIVGADMMYVDKWDWAGNKKWNTIRSRKDISFEQVKLFSETNTYAELTIPLLRSWGKRIGYNANSIGGIAVMGTESSYGQTSAGNIEQGRFFTEFEEERTANVIVLGSGVASSLFPNADALGKSVKVGKFSFQVIGILEKRGFLFMDFIDNQVFVPLKTFVNYFGSSRRSYSIAVKAFSVAGMDQLREESRGYMRNVRGLTANEDDDFSINESKAFDDNIKDIRLYIWSIGLGLTFLSFIVGIIGIMNIMFVSVAERTKEIGIMNIMFVSVAERTKEIGIRRALGAKKSSIITQFLVEASLLCFIGAIVALIGCSIIIFIGKVLIVKFYPDLSFISGYLPPSLLLIASSVSLFVGVLAGLVPAIRAANLDPVESLRFE